MSRMIEKKVPSTAAITPFHAFDDCACYHRVFLNLSRRSSKSVLARLVGFGMDLCVSLAPSVKCVVCMISGIAQTTGKRRRNLKASML